MSRGFIAANPNGDVRLTLGFAESAHPNWRAGDAATIVGRSGHLEELPAVWQALVSDRNRTRVHMLEAKLKSKGKPIFVIVGNGHLIGDDSTVPMLRAGRYCVQQMQCAGTLARAMSGRIADREWGLSLRRLRQRRDRLQGPPRNRSAAGACRDMLTCAGARSGSVPKHALRVTRLGHVCPMSLPTVGFGAAGGWIGTSMFPVIR